MLLWQEEVQWAAVNCRGKSSAAEVYRIAMACSLYYVWQERNMRIFRGKQRTVGAIGRMIIQEVIFRGTLKAKLAKKMESLNFYPSRIYYMDYKIV
uniref:Putative ovule protein n=1 Tax=Solanum chacoense TaxID=4108 RepID=A0A0V0H2J8_SOLCH